MGINYKLLLQVKVAVKDYREQFRNPHGKITRVKDDELWKSLVYTTKISFQMVLNLANSHT